MKKYKKEKNDLINSKEFEDKFKSFFDNSLVSNSITDKNGVFIEVNPTFLKITGYSNKKEVIGKSVSHFFENPGDLKKMMTLLKKEGKWSGEIIARRKDGSLFPVYGSCITLVDGDKKIVGYQSSMYDLAPRKKLEEELKENKKILEHAEEVANLGSYVLDINTGKWDSSLVLDKIFGIGKGCIYSVRTWENLIYPSDRKMMTDYFSNEVIRKRLLFNKEYRIVRKNDKQIRWVHGLGQLEFNAKKQPVKMMGTIQDITERKKSEEKLKESEEKYRIISENSKATMMLTLPDKTVSYLSPSSIDVFGWPAEDIMGKNKDIFYPGDRPKVFENLSKVLNGKSFKNFRYRIIGKDKKVYWISHSANPLFKNGKLVQVVSVIINIDEIKEAELEIGEYSERLKIATRAGKIGIWDWDIVKDNLIWDDTICELYGVPHGFFKGGAGKWSKHIIPEDRARAWKDLQAALRGEREYCPEFRIKWPDGSIHYIKVNSQAFFDKNGKAVRMVGTHIDITERKKIEEEIKENEEKFRSVFENSNDGILAADIKTNKFIFGNKKIKAMLGYSEEELIKLSSNEIHPKKDLNWILKKFREQAEKKISLAENIPIMRKDKTIFYADINASILSINEKNLLIGFFRDITERKKAEEELKRNTALLYETGKTAKVGGWEFDIKTLDLNWSAETYRIHEIEESCFHPTVEKAINFYAPSSKPIIEKAVNLAIKNGEPFDLELEIITAKGNHRWIRAIGKIILATDGSKKVSGIFQDITEKMKVENELKKAKENVDKLVLERTAELQKQTTFLSSILENIPNMIFVKDAKDLRFELFNKAGEELLGQKRKDLIGKNDYDFFPKKQADFFVEKDRAVLYNKKLLDISVEPIKTPHGERMLHTKKIPLLDSEGNSVYLLGISEDITERRKAEEELRRQKTFLSTIIENIPDMIFVKDAKEFKFEKMNRAGEELLGLKEEHMLGKTLLERFSKSQSEFFLAKDREVIKNKQLLDIPEENINTPHGTRVLHTKKIPIFNDKGVPEFLLGISEDITERRKAEEEVKNKNLELEKFNRVMVDRELKMVELKKKIKQLESKEK